MLRFFVGYTKILVKLAERVLFLKTDNVLLVFKELFKAIFCWLALIFAEIAYSWFHSLGIF